MADFKTKNKKLENIKVAARKLFMKYGFRKVSVEEISKESEVSKTTFYRFFTNKYELALTVYDEMLEEGYEKFSAIFKGEISLSEKLKRIVQLKLESANEISSDFLNDFYVKSDLGLAEQVEKRTDEMWRKIIKDFRHAQKQGMIREDLNLEFLFLFMQKTRELLNDGTFSAIFKTPTDMIMELTTLIVYGIFPNDKKKP